MQTMKKLRQSGELDGYLPGADERGLIVAVDEEVCNCATCPKCGTTGLRYLPYHCHNSQRSFAECPVCEYAYEF